jgi:hypothetical protein
VNLLSEIWSILTPAQRRQVLAAQAISLAMAISTVTGIAAITPFFSVLGNPRSIGQQRWLHWLYIHGGFTTEHTFVLSLGILFVGVVVFANFINAVGALAMNRLALDIGHQLQTALFDEYLDTVQQRHLRGWANQQRDLAECFHADHQHCHRLINHSFRSDTQSGNLHRASPGPRWWLPRDLPVGAEAAAASWADSLAGLV